MTHKTQNKVACPTEQLVLLHYGELDEAAEQRLENHLEQCSHCRSELAELQGLLKQVPTSVPEISDREVQQFSSRVMNKLPRKRRFGLPALGWTLTGAVILLFTFNLQQQGSTTAPQLQSAPVQMAAEQDVLNKLELLQDLDLLENLDLLQQLDSLG